MEFDKSKIDTSKLSNVKVQYITTYLTGKKILDVGAGYCYYSDWLVSTWPDLEVLSIDKLDLTGNGFRFMSADLEQPLQLQDNQFSTIFAFDIIEHIENEASFVKELFRVAAPGGMILGSVPHDDDQFLPAYNLTFNHRSDLTHKRYYVPESIQETLLSAGFHVIVINKEGGVSPQVIAEFFPTMTRTLIKRCVGLLRRIGVVNSKRLASDLFFVAYKPAESE